MKKVNLILSAIILMAILPMVSAVECYQEFANVSTVCGGLDTGLYGWDGSGWATPEFVSDGDWETEGHATDTNPCVYINYTIPDNTDSAIWEVKGGEGVYNITINALALSGNTLMLKACSPIEDSAKFSVYYSDTWNQEYTSSGGDFPPVYEEAVIWDIIVASPSPSPSASPDIIAGVLTSAGTGLGVFISAMTNPLVFIVLNIAIIGVLVGVIYFFSTWIRGVMKIK